MSPLWTHHECRSCYVFRFPVVNSSHVVDTRICCLNTSHKCCICLENWSTSFRLKNSYDIYIYICTYFIFLINHYKSLFNMIKTYLISHWLDLSTEVNCEVSETPLLSALQSRCVSGLRAVCPGAQGAQDGWTSQGGDDRNPMEHRWAVFKTSVLVDDYTWLY